MADCLKCKAKCAVHALQCEAETMKGKESIDCKTFQPLKKGQTTKNQEIPPLANLARLLADSMNGEP